MKNDLTSLSLFIAVCRSGSIAKAAEQHSIAASAISKRISDLEYYYKAPLLIRTKKGVEVTAIGAIVLNHAIQVQSILKKMEGDIQFLLENPKREVKLLANISSINEFLPEMLASFSTHHQDIKVTVEERFSHDIVKQLQNGYGDFGVARRIEYDTKQLDAIPFKTDHLVVVVNTKHPLSQLSSIDFIETLNYEHLILSTYATMNSRMTAMAADLGLQLNFKMQISSIDAACRLIGKSQIISILPKEALNYYIKHDNIVFIRLQDAWATGEFLIYLRKNIKLSCHANKLLNHMINLETSQ